MQKLEVALAGAMPFECRECNTIKTAVWVAFNGNACPECAFGVLQVMR